MPGIKMRQIVTTLLFLLLPFTASAQQGIVLYDETVKIQIELPPEMKHMEKEFPTSNSFSRVLYFDGAVSLMKTTPQEKEDEQIEAESGGMRIRMVARNADAEIYTDYDAATRIEQRDFLGRTFLVTGPLPELTWRLTDERAEFLGYACQKAVSTRDSIEDEAWFTTEIPVQAGPGPYGGLPGLILALHEDDGRRSFVAKEVMLDSVPDGLLQAPSKGREMSREEFDKMVEEKLKEMGGARPGRPNVMIRMQRE